VTFLRGKFQPQTFFPVGLTAPGGLALGPLYLIFLVVHITHLLIWAYHQPSAYRNRQARL